MGLIDVNQMEDTSNDNENGMWLIRMKKDGDSEVCLDEKSPRKTKLEMR